MYTEQQTQGSNFSVDQIDDPTIAETIKNLWEDSLFQNYLTDLRDRIKKGLDSEDGLEFALNQFEGERNVDIFQDEEIPLDAQTIREDDLSALLPSLTKLKLAIFYALAEAYNQETGSNFSATGFKLQTPEEPQFSRSEDVGGIAIKKDSADSKILDSLLISILRDYKALLVQDLSSTVENIKNFRPSSN